MSENKNRYYKHSRISEAKFRQVLRCFAMDMTATDTAALSGISVRSINSIYLKIRARISKLNTKQTAAVTKPTTAATAITLNQNSNIKDDQDVSDYLAFGIVQRGEKIYTELAPKDTRRALLNSQDHNIHLEDILNTAKMNGYDSLIDVNQAHFYRINKNHANDESTDQIEDYVDAFWIFVQQRLAQFNGIHKHTFVLHLKETEYRFNYRRDNLYSRLLKLLRSNPL